MPEEQKPYEAVPMTKKQKLKSAAPSPVEGETSQNMTHAIEWLSKQPEYKKFEYTNERHICYNVSAERWAELLSRYASLKLQQEKNKTIQEATTTIEKCLITIEKIGKIFDLLREAEPPQLDSLVDNVDLDFPLICAMIKDELSKLKG